MPRPLSLSCAPIVCALAAAPMLSADLTDDLESLTPGPLPQGIWEDMSTRVAGHTSPNTADVVSTTDAFGNPTTAIQTRPIFGRSTGFHTAAQLADVHDLTADVRVDTFGDGQSWATCVGLTMDDGSSDINDSPQCLVYPWHDGTWHFFVTEPDGGDSLILAPPIVLGHWYTINLRVDTTTGDINLLISDTATGLPLGGGASNIAGFTSNYDRLSFFDGEFVGTGTTSAQATIDNIRYVATGVVCPSDFNADGSIDSTDLAVLLAGWGGTEPDLDGDGGVTSSDLAVLLAAWGACD